MLQYQPKHIRVLKEDAIPTENLHPSPVFRSRKRTNPVKSEPRRRRKQPADQILQIVKTVEMAPDEKIIEIINNDAANNQLLSDIKEEN